MSQIDLLRRPSWTPSPQNGGRHQIRTGGRLTFGMPGRHHRNPHNRGCVDNLGKSPASGRFFHRFRSRQKPPHQPQNHWCAGAALGDASAGGIDIVWPVSAIRQSALDILAGHSVTKADVHGRHSPRSTASSSAIAKRSQAASADARYASGAEASCPKYACSSRFGRSGSSALASSTIAPCASA